MGDYSAFGKSNNNDYKPLPLPMIENVGRQPKSTTLPCILLLHLCKIIESREAKKPRAVLPVNQRAREKGLS